MAPSGPYAAELLNIGRCTFHALVQSDFERGASGRFDRAGKSRARTVHHLDLVEPATRQDETAGKYKDVEESTVGLSFVEEAGVRSPPDGAELKYLAGRSEELWWSADKAGGANRLERARTRPQLTSVRYTSKHYAD